MMIWSQKTDNGVPPVTVNVADQASLLADLQHRFDTGIGFSVATLNLDHVVKLKQDPLFHAAYAAHSHVTADGNPVVWLSHLAGQRDIRLLPGSELITPVAALAARCRVKVGLFGATDMSLARAAEALKQAHPGLDVVFQRAPTMGFDPDGPEAQDAITALSDSGARMVFLALGAPKQERFAARAAQQLPEVGFMSIGAGLDFLSGAQARAPGWARGLAAEWLWRMLSDPARLWPRYRACLLALPGLTAKALKTRRTVH